MRGVALFGIGVLAMVFGAVITAAALGNLIFQAQPMIGSTASAIASTVPTLMVTTAYADWSPISLASGLVVLGVGISLFVVWLIGFLYVPNQSAKPATAPKPATPLEPPGGES